MRIQLLDGFDCLLDGRPVQLPLGSQRLIALLAVTGVPMYRPVAAEQLWPDSYSSRAAANLRSALWSTKRMAGPVIAQSGGRLALAPAVSVDTTAALLQVDATTNTTRTPRPPAPCATGDSIVLLGRGLLPGWTEEWLEYERLRWDQLRVHALEQIASNLLGERRFVDAMRAAILAVSVDPIRESAHRIVVEIHLAEGNAASALCHGEQYRRMLQRELGASPSPHMEKLITRLTAR